jgi:hypothetical protein
MVYPNQNVYIGNGVTQMVTDNRIGEVQNRVEKIWLREDGIVQLVVLPGAEYTLAEAKQTLAGIDQVSNGKLRPILVDFRNIKTMERAAREELAACQGVTSAAILIDSALSRMIGNVLITFSKPTLPARIYNSEAAAIEWLKEFLE